MLIEWLHENFTEKGYRTMLIPSNERKNRRIYIEYAIKNGALYVVFLLDYHSGTEWERLEYDAVTRMVKTFFLEKGFEKVSYLHIIVTSHSERVMELGIYTDDYWVVDDENLKLMIYENQREDFLNARGIVEDTLQGKNLKWEKEFSVPVVSFSIIAINVIVFFIMEVFGSTLDTEFMLRHGAMNVERIIVNREYYRLLASMFLHFGIEHLANNMMVLVIFGYYMEGILGKVRFLILYLATGVVAGLVSFGYNLYMERYVVAAGASGAVFGMMGGLLYLVLKNHGKLQGLSFKRMAFFVFLSLYSGFTSQGVDNAAHIGGFLSGLLILMGMPAMVKNGGKR